MTFSDALNAMTSGKSVNRPSMQPGVAVYQVKTLVVNGAAAPGTPFLAMSTAPGIYPWQPSQADMAATDWALA